MGASHNETLTFPVSSIHKESHCPISNHYSTEIRGNDQVFLFKKKINFNFDQMEDLLFYQLELLATFIFDPWWITLIAEITSVSMKMLGHPSMRMK